MGERAAPLNPAIHEIAWDVKSTLTPRAGVLKVLDNLIEVLCQRGTIGLSFQLALFKTV